MKIALAQINYHIGNFDSNVDKMITALKTARFKGAELVVFAELAICGYPPRDFLNFDDFIELCSQNILKLAKECVGIAAIVGSPSLNSAKRGKKLFNSAYFLAEGKIQSLHHKGLLPTYDVFDEYRYFEPGTEYDIINYKNKKIALTICEDIWNIEGSYLYQKSPLESLDKHN